MKQLSAFKCSRTRVLYFVFCVLSVMNISCGTDRMDLQATLNNRAYHSGLSEIGEEVSENCAKMFLDGSEDVETFADTKKILGIEQIREMDAGTVLDISQIEGNQMDLLFYSEEPGAKVQQRIMGISYQENDNISLEELRYLRVLHVGFDGQTHIGELLVNQSIAEDVLEIMTELYENGYAIEKMVLVDDYSADDEQSMEDNNTSAFNYREIAGTSRMSRHSLGLAIDINPRYNPYVKQKSNGETVISPVNGAEYADRSQEFAHKIDENDLCYRLFMEHGFTWGGSWNSVKDYQHFER